MLSDKLVNLFYEEPDPDRWFKLDRYPRRIIRRIIRGVSKPGGQGTVAVNLMKGLDKIGAPYRFNDYNYIIKHPAEVACIIGKPHVFFDKKWANPVIFGAAIYSHSIECPQLFEKYPNVKRFLVPGEWMRRMLEPDYGDKVLAWPVGIDTDEWDVMPGQKKIDFLIYDKIRWQHDDYERSLLNPIVAVLEKYKLGYKFIRYGNYTHQQLKRDVQESKAVIFLCEHETQGLAYQQILSTDTPILAWDRGGYWQDPYYYPHKVKYQPVSSVPYWNDTCGEKFTGVEDFESSLNVFNKKLAQGAFSPRHYITENLSLEVCARRYLAILQQVKEEL
jgi:hypothetical protein